MKATHFPSAAHFRSWLGQYHATVAELWVGFYRKAAGKGGLTYAESVDEALCFGWIDGIVRKLDEFTYTHRFTPRKPGSTWSLVNVRRVARLTEAGKMHPAGLKAFAARDAKKTGIYTFEQRPQELPAALEKVFRKNKPAWTFWQAQPPGYRRGATWWVISAKEESTRHRRLTTLITDSAHGRRLGLLLKPAGKNKPV